MRTPRPSARLHREWRQEGKLPPLRLLLTLAAPRHQPAFRFDLVKCIAAVVIRFKCNGILCAVTRVSWKKQTLVKTDFERQVIWQQVFIPKSPFGETFRFVLSLLGVLLLEWTVDAS